MAKTDGWQTARNIATLAGAVIACTAAASMLVRGFGPQIGIQTIELADKQHEELKRHIDDGPSVKLLREIAKDVKEIKKR